MTARTRLDPATRAASILDEALRLFAERHFNAVSVRDIAAACGINAGLIYYYFENKDQLLRRVLGHALGQLYAGYDYGTERRDPAQALIAWLRVQAELAPMLIRMVKIMADYAASSIRDEQTDQLILDFYGREKTLLEDCLHRGIAQGLFRPMNVHRVARGITLQLDGIFYGCTARGDDKIAADIDDLCLMVELLRVAPVQL